MAAVEGNQVVEHRGRKRLGIEVPERRHREAHLVQVGGAGGATGKMLLEAGPIDRCHRPFEIVGHQLDRLAADQGAGGAPPPDHAAQARERGHLSLSFLPRDRYTGRGYLHAIADPDDALADDAALLVALRNGDEKAFVALVDRYHAGMLRVALSYVPSREAAEDVVQETWLGVLNGIDRFEQRSSLKTWIFRILVNRARTRGERESRTRPFSSLEREGEEPSVDPERFRRDGFWSAPPTAHSLPEDHVVMAEIGRQLLAAVDALSPAQRLVITLRDIEGLPAGEVCDLLGLSESNQRVLLHRARSKARAALERVLDSSAGGD